MTALPDWRVASDAELADAATAGDRQAFACIYDRYADRLHDFCVGMLRDRDAAADCVQDVFCVAATQLPKLRDSDKLRPWLYAIARNEALRCIRQRRREHVVDELPEAVSGEAGPDTLVRRNQLADLVAEAVGGLSERDRSVLDLTYRHGLDGPELAEALGVSPGNATKMVFRLRETVERSLGALLVARRAQQAGQACPELAAILEHWDGRFTILMRKRVARHIESCANCDAERRRMVNPVALLGGAPVFLTAPDWLRQQTLGQIKLTSAATPLGAGSGGSAPSADASGLRGVLDAAARAAATGTGHAGPIRRAGGKGGGRASALRRTALYGAGLVVAVAAAMLWLYRSDMPAAPTQSTPASTSPATTLPSGSPTATAPVSSAPPSYQPTAAPTSQAPGPATQSAPPPATSEQPANPPGTTQPTQQPPVVTSSAPPVGTQQAPTQQAPTQQAPTQQAPTQQAPTQQAPTQQAPTQQVPVQPTQQVPTQQVQQAPTQQVPVQPTQQAPTQPAPR